MYCVGAADSSAPGIGRHWGVGMRRGILIAAALAAWPIGMSAAQAGVVITIDKSVQQLTVAVDGAQRYQWPVSTARSGYVTPNGTYQPERLARKWYSRKYDWSPMPYSIFFDGGYAIHGSYEISHIGHPASHGCVRLHPRNAAVLFKLVRENRDDTTIVITGERPAYRPVRHRYHTSHYHYRYRRHSHVSRDGFRSIFDE